VVYEGGTGPGRGKHIVFVTGDEEYRSEEAMPMLAQVLAVRHGFKCTVLFAINPASGTIDPNCVTNIPGLHLLENADLMVIFTRFRELPDSQMKHVVDFVNSGKPIIGLRTATHAFAYNQNKNSPYAKYDWRSQTWPGGFGRQVLGETWVDHHGQHGKQSTRGIVSPDYKDHPVLRGVTDIWGPSDVYTVGKLTADTRVLVQGSVLTGMQPSDPAVEGPKNNPRMPLIWLHPYRGEAGRTTQVLCTTIGAAVDLQSEGLRRLLVNGCYWLLGLEQQIPARANVDYVRPYNPTYFGFGKFKPDLKPADHAP
jgi:hypothetical protein